MRSLASLFKRAKPVIGITVTLLIFRPLIALLGKKKQQQQQQQREHRLNKSVMLGHVFLLLPSLGKLWRYIPYNVVDICHSF